MRSLVMACALSMVAIPGWAVTYVDPPLLPDMLFAPALATRVRAPLMDDAPRPDLQVNAVPMFKTLRYPLLVDKQVKARIVPRSPDLALPRY